MRPWSLVWRGRQRVVGFWVDTALGEAAARRRVLQVSTPADTVRGLPGGYWVVLARPVDHTAPFPAAPVVLTEAGPSTVPLTADEAAACPPGRGLLLAREGRLTREEGEPVNPVQWLALGLSRVEVAHLGAAPVPPEAAAQTAPLTREDVGVDAPPEEVAQLLEGLGTGSMQELLSQTEPAPPTLWQRVGGTLRQWLSGLEREAPTGGTALEPAGPSWLDRLLAWLPAPGLQQRHQQLLEELMKRFDQEDLQEAIAWAIPLGGEGGSDKAFRGGLVRREGFAVGQSRSGGGGTIFGADDALAQLRRRYEAAAERLVQEGRIAGLGTV